MEEGGEIRERLEAQCLGRLQEEVTKEFGIPPQSLEIQIFLIILPLNKAPC